MDESNLIMVSRYSFWEIYVKRKRRTDYIGTMYRERGESESKAKERAMVMYTERRT